MMGGVTSSRLVAPARDRRAVRDRGGRGWPPDLLATAALVSLLIVVGLWMAHGGLSGLSAPGAALTSLGRLTGLVSADLLLIQVLLMARVPAIERAFGQDRLARWHRIVGFTSIDLMLAHVVLTTLGYAATDRTGPVGEFWTLVTTYPGMLLALAGTVALILVAVTSVRAARRRLRYESWHLLHLYAYLGVGLALPHELWTGTTFVGSAGATAYWWTAYGIATGALVVYRLGVPVWRNLRHRLVVAQVVREAPGIYSVYLRGRDLHRLPVRAGQFFQWRFLNGRGWTRAHPYSLSAAPRPDLLRITVKETDDRTARVRRLRPGTRVLIEGPYGALTDAVRRSSKVTFLAGGIGITPLRALLEEARYRPGDATLIYRSRSGSDVVFRTELDALAAHRGVRVHYLPGRRGGPGSWAPAGFGPDDLRRLVSDIAWHDVYICGPDGGVAAAAAAARRVGVPDEHLHLESFSW
jgi:predicted ferric reductase